MRIFKGFDNLPTFRHAVATIGSFDGLHRGHLMLLERTCELARERGGESVVLTFGTHPRVVLGHSEGLRLLSSMEEKIKMLEMLGVDNLIVIPFDKNFSRLPYDLFIKQYLVECIAIKTLVVGYNHHFGRGNEGGYNNIVAMSEECGFELSRVEEWRDESLGSVSSTVIRRLLADGDLDRASMLLSRHYLIIGQSDSEGRVWVDDSLKMIPREGRYRALINGEDGALEIDSNGVMIIDQYNIRVNIEVVSRL